ncbi:hypothetical protein FPV67DRAFT_1465310 [Lyophyllum atratum]|nr:hypothetical protein FPV67DRAFT_1465310 [Lyophyllum atratum]
MSSELSKLNVLMCGTGEYTTGWVGTGASKSDKKIGVNSTLHLSPYVIADLHDRSLVLPSSIFAA